MKKIVKTIISLTLLLVMATIAPLTDLSQGIAGAPKESKAADVQGKYISDFKVGMGETYEEAVKELKEEGYTILQGEDLDGKFGDADLNYKSGADSKYRYGAQQRAVYLGYKTTNDVKKAVTDLAVMNMEGGYSVKDYNALMDKQMDTQIKPFMDVFIAALEEYRANLKKPKDSANYIRADFVRRMLNKLTDDDSAGKPLGDLLVNKTKYERELENPNYSKQYEKEKDDVADILTILAQGNDYLVNLMENLIARGTDDSDDTWIERLSDKTLDSMVDEMMEKNPDISSEEEIYRELDKKYNDKAKELLTKWDELSEALSNVVQAQKIVDEFDEAEVEATMAEVENIDEDSATDEEIEEIVTAAEEAEAKNIEASDAGLTVALSDELGNYPYTFTAGGKSGKTLKDLFSMDASYFSGDDIRALYPVVSSLTDGQLAGLAFMRLKDLILVGVGDVSGYQETDVDIVDTGSIYDGVDRGIYEPGGVGLTNEELRSQSAKKEEATDDEKLAGATKAALALTVIFAVAAATMFALPPILDRVCGVTNYVNGMTQHVFSPWLGNMLGSMFAAGVVVFLVLTIVFSIDDLEEYYNIKYSPIPRYMVDEADITMINEKNEKVVVKNTTAYYKAVECNRKQVKTNQHELNVIQGTCADLNGDVGKQWLALYQVRNKNQAPILADSLKFRMGSSDVPDGYTTGIHMFGNTIAQNLTSNKYSFEDGAKGTYVYFKKDVQTVAEMAGSIFSVGGIALGGGIGLVVGGILGALIIIAAKRRKRNTGEGEFV